MARVKAAKRRREEGTLGARHRSRKMNRRSDGGDVEELAGPRHAYRLILLPIEVPWRRVHRDDELGACRQGAFQKTVVGFVPTLSSVSG